MEELRNKTWISHSIIKHIAAAVCSFGTIFISCGWSLSDVDCVHVEIVA